MNKDLTVGNPSSVLWRFCLPLFGSVIFQQLYNLADSFVAGKFVGENALAAVGNSYEITLIYIAFAFGCNIGCSVTVSRYFGSKEYGKLKTAVTTSLITAAALCAVLMSLGFVFGDGLLRLIETPTEIFDDSALYLRIYILGLPFVLFYNVSNGIFSALGDSKTPFIFLACSSLSNIGLDILFVTVLSSWFPSGVAAVAWATFICQGISCILALFFVFLRLRGIKSERSALFSFPILREIAAVAVPSTIQQSFISVGNIIIQSVINTFGTGVIAGYAAAVKLNNLVITSFTTLANGISNYTAQNLGAGKLSRIPDGHKAGLKLVWLLCVPFTLVYFFLGKYLVMFFLKDPQTDALESGIMFLRILSPFYLIISAKLVSDGILRGSKMMKQFMAGTFTDLILRVFLAELLSKTVLGSVGIWLSWPLGWIVAAVMSYLFYRRGVWYKQKL